MLSRNLDFIFSSFLYSLESLKREPHHVPSTLRKGLLECVPPLLLLIHIKPGNVVMKLLCEHPTNNLKHTGNRGLENSLGGHTHFGGEGKRGKCKQEQMGMTGPQNTWEVI